MGNTSSDVSPILSLITLIGYSSSFMRFSRSHTTTHHSRKDSSGRVISSSQRPLPDNTKHSQQTNFHAPGGIQTHDPSRRAAVDLRLRPRGHWRSACWKLKLKKRNINTNKGFEPCPRVRLKGRSYAEILHRELCVPSFLSLGYRSVIGCRE